MPPSDDISALFLNCTLKPSPVESNTEALGRVMMGAMEADGVDCDIVRLVDLSIRPGVSTDEGEGDEWPPIHDRVLAATGNEDGAHHVIAEISGALCDLGFTIPGQSWTYWNRGPGPGDSYLEDESGHDWSHSTARAAASNLVAVARALRDRPIPPPPS